MNYTCIFSGKNLSSSLKTIGAQLVYDCDFHLCTYHSSLFIVTNLMDRQKRSTCSDEIDIADMPTEMEQASEEVRAARKIRKVNFAKAMAYGQASRDAQAAASSADPVQESTTAKQDNPFAAILAKLDAEKAAKVKAAESKPTESAQPVSEQDRKDEAPTSAAETETAPEAAKPLETKPNPFAIPSSNPFSVGFSAAQSFTAAANRPAESAPAEEADEPLPEEETQQASAEKSTLENETVVARCHVKAFQLNTDRKGWGEIGTGYAKLCAHNDLIAEKAELSDEANCARISFHDSRSGMQRVNLALGEALVINPAKSAEDKNILFTATVQTAAGEETKLEKQTFFFKEIAAKSIQAENTEREDIVNLREKLMTYTERVTRNASNASA